DEAHRALHAGGIAALREVGEALAVRDRDRQAAAGHAGEEQARAVEDLDQRQPRLELLAAVAREAGPGVGPGNDGRQRSHHLATVADAEREGVGAREEGGELLRQPRVEHDRTRPALAGTERVTVAE